MPVTDLPLLKLLQNLDKLGSRAERFLLHRRNQLLFQIIVSVLMMAAGKQPWQEPLIFLAGPSQTFLKICFWCDNSALSPLAAFLTPPLMKAVADGYHLLVELEDMGPAFQFCVLYWEKGQESRVSLSLDFGMKREPTCLRAKAEKHFPGTVFQVQPAAARLEHLSGISMCHAPLHCRLLLYYSTAISLLGFWNWFPSFLEIQVNEMNLVL